MKKQPDLFDMTKTAPTPTPTPTCRRRLQGTMAGPMPEGAELVESQCPVCSATVWYAFVGADQAGVYDLDGQPHGCGGGVFHVIDGN